MTFDREELEQQFVAANWLAHHPFGEGHEVHIQEDGLAYICTCSERLVKTPNGWENRPKWEEATLSDQTPLEGLFEEPSHPFSPGPDEVPASDKVLEAIVEDLRQWWMNTAADDFAEMEPKIGEYTASDLILMGQFMEHWLGLPPGSGAEAATLWYALGKVARAVAAYREGRLPSEDTLHDLSVYAMMARRIRQTGRWP
jgi:hypothetical protein